ncbi:hypothetical protein AVEN_216159-1 [Araneus ventricosus]|uniref:Tc1-like transposase DDE domain-containing protein n=1 Tax=Araneus ventricosus TaxID=182803 RepID=A0A4Y2I9H4_ARAVE|nr:hypothetical protein AVEN_216159-1 [Araneus ventricosus]
MYYLACSSPIHGGSSMESGFGPSTLRSRGRDLTTRPPRSIIESNRQLSKEKRKDVISDFLKDLPLSDLRNVWFQHDGAPQHNLSSVQQYIRDTFQQQVIGYGGSVEWPPRSPDLNPRDFFLWGYIKQRMQATLPPTLQELRNRITDAYASVPPAML